MPVTLSLVDVSECTKRGVGVAGEMRGGDARHLAERRDQAVDMAAMLDAFADREDVRVGGAHVVVDHDAAVDVEPGLLGERRRSGRMPTAITTRSAGMIAAVRRARTPSTLPSPRIALVLALVRTLMPRCFERLSAAGSRPPRRAGAPSASASGGRR